MSAYEDDLIARRALSTLWSISEPIGELDPARIIACPTCTAPRDFDDPADCPDCAGTREIVL